MPGLSPAMRLRLLNKAISEARPAFEQAGVLKVREEGDVWRMTAWVSALAPLDYGEVLEQTSKAADPLLAELSDDVRGKVSLGVSGIMPLVHQIQGRLLTDLFSSLMSALLVITVVMTVVQAGFLNGLLAMASNVFPIVIAFGVMGLLRHPMDIGSVMTASIALGIAVDDTLHFLTFFRRSLSVRGTTREQAVLDTFLDCGPAMIQTSISCGLGLLVFAFSDFVPTSRFAVLMAFLLLLALLGDLLMLPALLLSPAGRLFETRESVPISPRETQDLAKTAE
ncbi:MAG UNVERIFIED_CONTAM: MMPL family transporter [Planctomycetaceae bacterium]